MFFIRYLCSRKSLSASDSVGPDYLLSCSAFLPCLVKSRGWKGKWFLGGLPAAGESNIWTQCIQRNNKPSRISVGITAGSSAGPQVWPSGQKIK